MGLVAKVIEKLREEGPRDGVRSILREAGRRVVDSNRDVLLLRVDLTNTKFHRKPKDPGPDELRLLRFDRASLPGVVRMLRRAEPERIDSVRVRLGLGVPGFVAELNGEVVGYVFWVEHASKGIIHADMNWLKLKPRPGEIYVFDYFVPEGRRGAGNALVRAVQQAHAEMGYTAAYGYVYAANRPALWLYRTTGWKEVKKIKEHRLVSRFAVVDGTLFRMQAMSRTPVLRLPFVADRG